MEDFQKGIPRLGALLDSNDSFCVFRRYGATAARIILQRELEIENLVEQLHKLDERDAARRTKEYRLVTVKHTEEGDTEQRDLIDAIEVKILRYCEWARSYSSRRRCWWALQIIDDLLLKYMDVRALGRPPGRDQLSVYNWIKKERPLMKGEDTFIRYIDDLVSAKKKMESNGQSANNVEDMLDWLSGKPLGSFLNVWQPSTPQTVSSATGECNRLTCAQTLLRSKNAHRKTSNPRIFHHSSDRLAICGRLIVVFLAVNFLLIPVFLLFLVQMSRAAMALVVMGFLLAFAAVLALVAQARMGEILIGTAA